MGMFDYVNYECECPKCGEDVNNFQSKGGDCVLDLIEPCTVSNFYGSCGCCRTWLQFEVIPPKECEIIMQPLRIEYDT